MSLSRIKSMAGSRKTYKESDVKKLSDDNLKSPFLLLSAELRNEIYCYAFTRTNIECLQALQLGPQANSASGLFFSCRQIREETRALYQADAITCMWPWFAQDSQPYSALVYKNPVIQDWQRSYHGLALRHRPETIKSIAWQISLARNSRSACDHFVDAPVFEAGLVKPADVYIQVCICDALSWLHDTPDRTMTFCIAVETIAMKFPSLERIHVYYCGRTWPDWIGNSGAIDFSGIVFARHQIRTYSGANWRVNRVVSNDPLDEHPEVSMKRTGDNSLGWSVKEGGPSRMSTEMYWNTTQAHPGSQVQVVPWKERTVRINYYDSWSLCTERCVRNKPQPTTRARSKYRIVRLDYDELKICRSCAPKAFDSGKRSFEDETII